MKRAWQKIDKGGLLREYVLFGCLVLVSGSLLIVQIIKIADRAATIADGTRFIALSVALFLAVVAWAGYALYKKSAAYLRWYREIFDAMPIPLIITDGDTQWQAINKAMRETMDIKADCDIEALHSRHLLNLDGSIKNKIWLHKGGQYQVAGKPLCCDGKDAGYLIYLNGEGGISESVKLQTEMAVKVNHCIKRLSAETSYFRDCTNNISRCMLWQSGVIIELFEIIDGLAVNGVQDSSGLVARMAAIRADMRNHAEENQADLERIQRLIQELNEVREVGGDCIRSNNNAS